MYIAPYSTAVLYNVQLLNGDIFTGHFSNMVTFIILFLNNIGETSTALQGNNYALRTRPFRWDDKVIKEDRSVTTWSPSPSD